MSIENITGKIMSEAKDISEASRRNAEGRSLEILNEARKQAEEILSEADEKAKREAETLKSRKVSAAELQARKMLLGAKQNAVKDSFNAALNNLKNMSKEKYISFLAEEILKISNCEGEIILNETDKKNIGEKLVKVVNEKLKAEKVVLSKGTITASGGFILKNGDIEINSTFETLLDSIKDGITFDVANALFK